MIRRLPIFRPLSGLVLLVGVAGGAVGAAYVLVLRGLTDLIGTDGHSGGAVIVVLVATGVAIALLTRWLGDPGDVELLVDNIHLSGGSADTRSLRSLIPVSLLGIAAGGALGPEAPLVQTSGTTATFIGQRAGLTPDRLRILTIVGMASAFAVLFGAPLGSAVFALEILHRRGLEYYEALMPALGGALIGFAVSLVLQGNGFGPIFQLPASEVGEVADLGWAALAAVVGSGLAVAFTVVVRLSRRLAVRVPVLIRPAVGGLVVGLLALWSVGALTFGEHQITDLTLPGVTVGALAAA